MPSTEQGGKNLLLWRFNSEGAVIQPRIIGGLKDETAADIEVLSNGYLIVGTIGSSSSDQKGYVWKLSTNIYAVPISEHEIDIEPSSTNKSSFSVKAMTSFKDDSYLIAGQYFNGNSSQMLIFETDIDGAFVPGKIRIEGGSGNQTANDVITAGEDIIAIGKNTLESSSLISLLKFRF